MGARVCGASAERDALSAARCWCRGLFCYRGGYKASAQWRRDFTKTLPCLTFADFEESMRQMDLYAGTELAAKWGARLEAHAPARRAKGKSCAVAS